VASLPRELKKSVQITDIRIRILLSSCIWICFLSTWLLFLDAKQQHTM